jgi:hypothetical protein
MYDPPMAAPYRRPLLCNASTGAVVAPVVPVADPQFTQPIGYAAPPQQTGITTGPLLVGGLVVGLVGVGIWMWNKDQTRLASMTPEARHQENMDRLAAGAAYSVLGALRDRD